MVAGPIPYSSVLHWAHSSGIDDIDEIDDLAEVIWKADDMVQKHLKDKPKTLTAPQKPVPKTPIGMGGTQPRLPAPTGSVASRMRRN